MEMLKSACYFIGVLSVLIIVHEWGHFIVAKLCKMRVDDFSLFFGKVIWHIGTFNGTSYNLRSVPLGGFVKIAGMEPDDALLSGDSIFLGMSTSELPFDTDKYDRTLRGVGDDTFAAVRIENLSERVVEAVSGAVDSSGWLTAGGKEYLETLLVSTGLNSDEHAYIQAILAAGQAAAIPDPNGYNQKPLWQRALVIFAGPMMSLLFGYALFCAMGFTTGLPDADNKHPAVGEVFADKPAARAGLQSGDWILAVNGREIRYSNVFFALRSSVDRLNGSKPLPLRLSLLRGGQPLDITVMPYTEKDILIDMNGRALKGSDKKDLIGYVSKIGISIDQVWARHGVVKSIKEGTEIIKDEVNSVRTGIFSKDVKNNVGGIITIGKVINDNSKQGTNHVLYVAAMLSVSLGIMNLFPIPVLDGGHLMLLLWEFLRRRRLSGREVYGAQMVGLCIIGVLFVLITFNDIVHWIHHQ